MYVFLSYSSKNQTDADSLKKLLEESGIEVWMAPDSIPTGKSYMTEIIPAIENCSCFVLLLTEESEKSFYVQCELSTATGAMPTRIIPISKGYMPQGAFKFPFQTIQIKKVQSIDANDQSLIGLLRFIKDTAMKETVPENQEPQLFKAFCISVLSDGRFLYLGNSTLQFSTDNTCYFLYDKKQNNAILAHLPDLQMLGQVKCDPENMACSYINPSPDNNYLLMYTKERIWIADLFAHKWIIQNKRLKMNKDEKLLYLSWGNSDNVYLMLGKENKNRFQISCITELSTQTTKEKRNEVTAVCLYEPVGSRKLDDKEWVFFATEGNKLAAVCFKDMQYTASAWEILEKIRTKIPASSTGIDCFSPDSLSFYLCQQSGTGDFVNVYDTKDQIRLLQLPSADMGGISLLNDYQALIYNHTKGTVFLHDFKTQTRNTMIDAQFFRENACFYHHFPFGAAFDRLTYCTLFLAIDKETDHFRIVAVDRHKQIIAISEENQVPYKDWNSAEISLMPGGCIVGFNVIQGDKEFRYNGVNSYLYHAQFHRENGRLVFE